MTVLHAYAVRIGVMEYIYPVQCDKIRNAGVVWLAISFYCHIYGIQICNKSFKSLPDPPMTGVCECIFMGCVSYKQVTDHKMKLPAKFASKLLKVSDFSDRWGVLVCSCVCACVCVLAWVCPLDKAELIWPHTGKVKGVGRLAWLGQMTHAVHRVRRALSLTVCADCYRCRCRCRCRSRSCGDLKSTFKAERDWKSTWNRKPMSRAALPPVAPYQSCTAPSVGPMKRWGSSACGLWLLTAACGCSALGHN